MYSLKFWISLIICSSIGRRSNHTPCNITACPKSLKTTKSQSILSMGAFENFAMKFIKHGTSVVGEHKSMCIFMSCWPIIVLWLPYCYCVMFKNLCMRICKMTKKFELMFLQISTSLVYRIDLHLLILLHLNSWWVLAGSVLWSWRITFLETCWKSSQLEKNTWYWTSNLKYIYLM